MNEVETRIKILTLLAENKQISIYDENHNKVSSTNAKFDTYIKYYHEDI